MSRGSSPSVSSAPPKKQDDDMKDSAFFDRDVNIHDPILSTQSMYQAIRLVMENAATSRYILNLYLSNLVKFVVP